MGESSGDGGLGKIVVGADAFGAPLKDHLVPYLKGKGIQIDDLGVDKYYTVAEAVGKIVSSEKEQGLHTRGLLVCGTGIGVSIFANKFKGVYAAPCTSVDDARNSRSINDCNVLTLGGNVVNPDEGEKIVDAWLDTQYKDPCAASSNQPWPQDIHQFLDKATGEMDNISQVSVVSNSCAICALAEGRKFDDVEIMPGGSWNILKENPTSAIIRFKAGSIEPAHHHTFGHDLFVIQGKKRVWNLSKKEIFDLGPGDFLYTPAGDVHRVYYFTDTEFFLRWDGHWDIFLDEDLETARRATDEGALGLS